MLCVDFYQNEQINKQKCETLFTNLDTKPEWCVLYHYLKTLLLTEILHPETSLMIYMWLDRNLYPPCLLENVMGCEVTNPNKGIKLSKEMFS